MLLIWCNIRIFVRRFFSQVTQYVSNVFFTMALKSHFALLAFTAPFLNISVHFSKTGAHFSEVSVQFSKINTSLISVSVHF